MFHVEFTRARDNVVLLTDDRAALIEALETALGEQMSALKATGEQLEVSTSTSALPQTGLQHPPLEREAVLDGTTREHRKAVDRFLDRVLSAVAASVRQRAELSHYAAADGTRIT